VAALGPRCRFTFSDQLTAKNTCPIGTRILREIIQKDTFKLPTRSEPPRGLGKGCTGNPFLRPPSPESNRNRTLVETHLRQIKNAGAGVVVLSWWRRPDGQVCSIARPLSP
jgi:hypothetical protein